MRRTHEIAIAATWGVVNHVLFAAAIAMLVNGLYHGLTTGSGRLHGASAWLANTLLVVQFPLIHSYLLTPDGRRRLASLAPRGLGADLAPTTFTMIASLQLIGTFALWTPSGILLHQATGGWLWLFRAAFFASWVVLLKAMRDAGLGVQTGYVGWLSVVRGEKPSFGDFPTHGLFRHCRQPVYLGFALTLWTAPIHTLDGLLIALPWSMYCVAAPLHKELRYLSAYGERFSKYRSLVPYFLPRIRS